MALKFIEGFEEYANSPYLEIGAAYTNDGYGWTYAEGGISINSTTVRTNSGSGGRSLTLGMAYNLALTVPSVSEIFVGFGFYSAASAARQIVYFCASPAGTGSGVYLSWNTDGSIAFKNAFSGATITTSAAGVLPKDTWHYIEIRYKYGATGDMQVRVDGTDVITQTGIDVRGNTTEIKAINFYNSGSTYYDDMYVCDTTGTSNNTFLGPVHVYTLTPNADASVQMTPSAGTTNYDKVDEMPNDTTTTYVSATSAGLTDLYGMSDLPAITPTSIAGVQVNTRSRKPTANAAALQLGVKSGATTTFSATKALATSSWIFNFAIWEKQPDTTAWDKTAVDAMNVGIKSV